jgi:hypothetical protein
MASPARSARNVTPTSPSSQTLQETDWAFAAVSGTIGKSQCDESKLDGPRDRAFYWRTSVSWSVFIALPV